MYPSRLARFVSIMVLAVVLVATMPSGAAAQGGGNSGDAHACQQGGYAQWLTADGDTFTNAGECVSYAAQGGTLVPLAHAACLAGNHTAMARSVAYALAFTSAAECRAYLDAGGEIVPWQRGYAYAYTDIRYSFRNGRIDGCTARAVVHVEGYSHAVATFTGLFASNSSQVPRALYGNEWSTWGVYLIPGSGGGSTTVTVQGAWYDWSTGTTHNGDVLIADWALDSYCSNG